MDVDESVVAFWNWTRISFALEEEDKKGTVGGYSRDSDDIDTLLISICCIIGALFTLWVLYRYNVSLLQNLLINNCFIDCTTAYSYPAAT